MRKYYLSERARLRNLVRSFVVSLAEYKNSLKSLALVCRAWEV